MRVGFIGTGEIAAAMVQGLSGRGHKLLVSERNVQVAESLREEFPDVEVSSNMDVVTNSEVVFLCLMADVARNILPMLPWRADHSIISVMVDVPLVDLGKLCAPANDIALTIPLSAVAVGGSVLPCYPESRALTELFGESDTIIPVASEAGLNAHFAASALSAPLLTLMQAGAGWLAGQTGDANGAEAYVAGVFAGFLRQMHEQETDFDHLLQSLATEGGLNDTLKENMAAAGTPEVLLNGLNDLKPRLGL